VTSNENKKYERNRNVWRKVLSFERKKPRLNNFTDLTTGESFTYDLETTLRHRDYYMLKKAAETGIFAEYDEGLIEFSDSSFATTNFSFCFSALPDAVVLTVEPNMDYSDNVIPYGYTFNECSMSIGLSAPFTGFVRYRAIYSATGYPAQAQSTLVPASGTFIVAAGFVDENNNSNYTASFAALSSAPTLFYRTPWDFNVNFDNDVELSQENSTNSTVEGEISSPITNKIYFLAVE
jgi:hypothetical protein